MHKHFNYLQRLIATALSFAIFGLGGVLLRLAIFPFVDLLVHDQHRKRSYSRRIVSATFLWFVNIMRALGVLTYEISGAHKLGQPGQLIISNHPSLIDVVFLVAFTRDANCVVKSSLKRNTFMRGPISATQYVDNNTTAEMIENSCKVLADGETLIIFPEGTRTIPWQPLHFHRSAANIAIKSARVLTPVILRVEPTTLTKAEPWYRIPHRRFHFSMQVLDDIALEPFRAGAELPRASRTLNTHLLSFFNQELGHYGRA